MSAPTELAAWRELAAHHEQIAGDRIESYFDADPDRASRFSVDLGAIRLDYSKNHITSDTLELLCRLAAERDVAGQIEAMTSGAIINLTEEQPVLHLALRGSLERDLEVDGRSLAETVKDDRAAIYRYCDEIRSGAVTGATGERFTDVVHIGIGGSSAGPQVILQALSHLEIGLPKVWFLQNLDANHFASVLSRVKLASTLFILCSKSFSTEETLANATAIRELLQADGLDPQRHFVALTNKVDAAREFGITKVFPVRDWIPGRFSSWGPLALPICLSIGQEAYEEILAGAREMDRHFLTAPFDANMPVILALLSVWHTNFWGAATQAFLPYAEDLGLLIPYLQQLETECNGKSVDRQGRPVEYATSPIVWGGVGTTGQHAFYQLLHQGTHIVPCDFLMVEQPVDDPHGLHVRVLANCIAQSRALMVGNRGTAEDGRPYPEHRYIEGNKPSNTIVLDRLAPATLGMLIALYENKVTVQGFLWNINSFDQWGVEIGKVIAREVLEDLRAKGRG